jgi:protein-S-isoprenylcysteine O-methyltransferase Ste14
MKLESVERTVQWAGALGALVAAVAVYSGVVRGAGKARAEETENLPEIARPFLGGSPLLYLPRSVAALWLLRLLWRPILRGVSAPVRAALLAAGSLLYFPGLTLMLWGRLTMKDMHNVSSDFGSQLYADHRLVRSGPFGLMRHPMYVGGIMAELGALLIYRTWATLLITVNAPLLPIRARREEELLAAHFGAEWEEYAHEVPMWPTRRGVRTGD